MLYDMLADIYNKMRLTHYRQLFASIRDREGSLSAVEAFSVDAIYLLDRPTIKQFSDFLGISKPNATYKITNLIEKGYVTKVPSDEDKREARLFVTDKFLNYLGGRTQFISDAAEKLSEQFSEKELELFEKMLEALYRGEKEDV